MAKLWIDGSQVNYICEGEGKDIILLHGWGQNIEMMLPIFDHLKQKYRVYVLDFPGFGASDDPRIPYGVEEYAQMLSSFVETWKITSPILIGHSFGCRVAIHYAVDHPVEKMILTGAAGLRNKRGLRYYVRLYVFKLLKKICQLPFLRQYQERLRKLFGSSDYKNTTGVMRSTFVKVVNDDVRTLLPKLSMPVLLVFGEKDEQTPLWMGKEMEALIPNAGLAVFEQSGHYAYLEQLDRFLRVCDVFL